MRLEGKTAIVTGSGSGFGEGIALTLAREGAAVIVNDVNTDGGNRVASEITDGGGRAIFVDADVTSADDVQAMVDQAVEAFGGLDILINNAGVSHKRKAMLDVTEAELDRILAVNVKGLFHTANAAIPAMRNAGGGAIINIASTGAVRPRPGLTWYNATKGAVTTLTKSMAVELADDKIRVNAVNPVAGDTPLLATFLGEDTPENREAFRQTVPLGRLSTPEDVANAVLFLASDEAALITGVCLEVDGGRCI
ncbi:MAG: glucose 1-dehydrogenase [Rhodospirillaceae bacterium]|jgi:3-oxoacyl-[acyl-carrier protein] reductase|nr:glucose 1-dehydrogenase [Rhodospirillaceae bacterium]MBT5359751.1 glucose 1-dehydrogenase [Rhodospirillaceae bacterium]MBT5943399.1 glucose 1-dehydrogenase [Rhodospirillaceae bacterium]MBT6404554.1 glucose 1-dehydrogenase [Rhodospirillaceae bacterium]MBT7362285.1 glucose 1-dehydrogenase [Rhodospirillaceae bacterium]